MILGALADLYQQTILFVMYALLLSLFIALSFVKWGRAIPLFIGVRKKTWLWLLFILFAGAILRFFIFPTYHLMYTDEPLYMELASNLNHRLQPALCILENNGEGEVCWLWNQKPPGWPFLISLGFLAFGEDERVGFFLSALFGSLSILLIFFLCFLLFRSEKAGLWASALLAFSPLHIIWSHSAEANIPSVFFILTATAAFFLYRETKDTSLLLTLLLLAILASLVRYENSMLIALFFLIFRLDWAALRWPRHRKWLSAVLLASGMIGAVILTLLFAGFFRSVFPFFSLLDLFLLNLFPFLKAASFNYLYVAIAAALLFLKRGMKNKGNGTFFALVFFFVFSCIYILIYSEDRMALTPSIFLILVAAESLERICLALPAKFPKTLLMVGLLLLYIASGTYTVTLFQGSRLSHQSLLETESASQIRQQLLDNCTVIAEFPIVLEPTPLGLYPTSAAILNPGYVARLLEKGRCVYYFSDSYCFPPSISRAVDSATRCMHFQRMFAMTPEMTFAKYGLEYTLFRITGPVQKS